MRPIILNKKPSDSINCLLLYPRFSKFSFWNTRDVVQMVGAKAPAPPLGLITVAAILPQHWKFKLIDLNTQGMDDSLWEWADLVCVGGMLPQQDGILEALSEAKRRGVFSVVGGPDPTSQPDLYKEASARVLNEGEVTIPIWLDAWEKGRPEGLFVTDKKPDVTDSPMPRFELLNFSDYYAMGVQYARGCPFNCEFCDIIELFGRTPRQKKPRQLLDELQRLYELGYRGYVEIVDDNFIGNKRHVKREFLPRLIAWNKARGNPFYFGVEASMNLGDDDKLLELMKEAYFRFVFMGIETPDPELLLKTQKSQNTMRPVHKRVLNVVRHGMIVTAGFIIGFDGEKEGTHRSIIQCIEDSAINMAMMGLLVALPNTQLTRRLTKEGRLMDFSGRLLGKDGQLTSAKLDDMAVQAVDQTLAGLNFVTTRDRFEIMDEFAEVMSTIYERKSYMKRVMKTVRTMEYRLPRLPKWWEFKRSMRGLFVMSWRMTKDKDLRWVYWKNFFAALSLGFYRFEMALTLMALYFHFRAHAEHLQELIPKYKETQKSTPTQMSDLDQVS